MLFDTQARRRGLLLCSVATLMAGTARAQNAEASAAATVDEVIVTGTSIRGVAPVGSPTTSLGEEQILATGFSNTNDILRTNPAFANLGMSEGRGGSNQSAQANITQASSLNLRGIGQESTLVLLDGRRIQPSGTMAAFYDVSTLPINAIQRVEVVADGASAIYGSDAVGGVVNFITKRNYDGAETSFRYGEARGYDEYRVLQNLGKTWEGGGVFFAFEHFARGPLLGTARKEVTQDLRPLGGPDLRANFGSPGTIVVSGVTYAVPTGQNGRGLTASRLVAGSQNLLDLNLSRSLLSDFEKDNFLLSVRHHLTAGLEVWYSGYVAQRHLTYEGTSLNGGATTAALTVPRSNPFFVHPTNPAAASVVVNYGFINDFRAVDTAKERGWHNAVGFVWSDLPYDWSVEGHASRSVNRASRVTTGQLRTINLAAALADTNPATAFNPFCDGFAFSCNNPATLERLNGFSIIAARLVLKDFVAKASGPLFDIWGGTIQAAVGVEYTDHRSVTENGRNTVTVAPAIRVTEAERDVKSIYGELLVPLVGTENAMSGVQRLELSLALRREDYSDFGTTTNPKVGVRWDPIQDLSIRATYGTSFRAPTIGQIDFLSSTTYSIVNLPDPRLGGQVRALQLVGAREGLQPESATTYSLGLDWVPTSVPGLRVSATLYDIDYKDRIVSIPIATLLANEATLPDFVIRNPSADFVNSFLNTPYLNTPTEPASNIKLFVDGRTSNTGGLKQTGLDLSVDYEWETGIGTLDAGVAANFILRAKQSLFAGQPFVDIVDKINYPVSKRARAHLGWRNDGWRANLFADYVDDYTNDLAPVTVDRSVASWLTFDASASYTFGDEVPKWARDTRVAVSVNNLFDRDPPKVVNVISGAQGLYDSQAASVIGRAFAIEITKTW